LKVRLVSTLGAYKVKNLGFPNFAFSNSTLYRYVAGEPQGGMYVAWSSNSEYLAATSDSLHAVAVGLCTLNQVDP
jgi:hypothetical protein